MGSQVRILSRASTVSAVEYEVRHKVGLAQLYAVPRCHQPKLVSDSFMIGVDLGISSFKAVEIEKEKIKRKKRVFLNEKESVEKQLKNFFSDSFFFEEKKIAVTGAYSSKLKELKGKKIFRINEIQAIAKGSRFLSKEKNFLAASVGTGCCFVSVKKEKASHIGGTALGGKTILGLSRLLTGKTDFKEIEKKALKGDYKKIDLMLSDVYPKGIGLLKGNVSVSNFGKIKSKKEEDLLAGVFNSVFQGISTNALFAAKALKHEKIVFSGSLAETKLFRKTFKECRNAFHLAEAVFPENGAYAGAVGAVVSV